MWDYEPINVLQDLRLQLEHEGFPLPSGLHAKNDARPMKTRVFNLLSRQTIYIHSIALRKAKVYETLRDDEAFVYRIACRILFQSLFTRFLADQDDHSIVFSNYSGGSVAQKLKDFQRKLIEEFGTVHRSKRIAFWDASTHAGLQIADYCSWMLQRHLEMPTEEQSVQFHQLMKARIANLYLPFG